MQVRRATPEDAETIAVINVHTWQVAYAGIVPAEILDAKQPSPPTANLREWLRRTDRAGDTLVAVDDADTVVGYTHFGPLRTPDGADAAEGEIHAIYVTPQAWRSGAGQAMMTGALQALAERGRSVVRLWVLADNDGARRFYERCGFAPDGTDRVERLTFGTDGVAELAEVRYARFG